MLNIEDRIQLRDELFNSFKLLTNRINKTTIDNIISSNLELQSMYSIYVAEFRTENEAIHCLRHQDDFSNHICPACGNIAMFYCNKHSGEYRYRKVCSAQCHGKRVGSEEAKQKRIDTNKDRFGYDNAMQNPDILAKFIQSMLNKYGVKWALQHPKIVEIWRKNYQENHGIIDPILLKETQPILNQIEEGLILTDAYSNEKYFKQFIQFFYLYKNRLLKINEIMNIFDKSFPTIDQRIHELKLEGYFDIRDSNTELQFRDFLIENNYIEDKDFERHLFNLYVNENSKHQLDFTFNNHKIAFEVNDIGGHNSTRKDSNYHINKTRMARDQHNIRLIHLWEWELNETNWSKTSQWILHLLNQNKIQLTLDDCIIDRVSKEDEIIFLNQYSITSYQESDICIGIYNDNNELIQTLSFKDNVLSICTKFGYELIKDTYQIIQSYMNYKQLDHILTYCNLDKFTGTTFENLGFQLLEYQAPSIISELLNESSEYKQLYNCGYNIYVMFKR